MFFDIRITQQEARTAMTAYRQFWVLTALLLCAAIYAAYAGAISWGFEKFPQLPIQLAFGFIQLVFLWAYAGIGHGAAVLIARNEHALDVMQQDIPLIGDKSEVERVLLETADLRKRGQEQRQLDFSILHDVMREQFEGRLMEDVGRIDVIRVFMFFFGLLFTLVGVVQGFASQQFPTNSEEAKIYSFTIIKALGLAYLPAAGCIGATLILFVLSNLLQKRIGTLLSRFDVVLYRVAILGETKTGRPALTLERSEPHASTQKS
jgi:hypothetical protein